MAAETDIYGYPKDDPATVDIHGTNWAEHQRVFKIERDPSNHCIACLHLSVPLQDGQVATLLEHLRTWHP